MRARLATDKECEEYDLKPGTIRVADSLTDEDTGISHYLETDDAQLLLLDLKAALTIEAGGGSK